MKRLGILCVLPLLVAILGANDSYAPGLCASENPTGTVLREQGNGLFWFDVEWLITNCGSDYGEFRIESEGGENCGGFEKQVAETLLLPGSTYRFELYFKSTTHEPPDTRCRYEASLEGDVRLIGHIEEWPTLAPTAIPSPMQTAITSEPTEVPTPTLFPPSTSSPTPLATLVPVPVPSPTQTNFTQVQPPAESHAPMSSPTPTEQATVVLTQAPVDPPSTLPVSSPPMEPSQATFASNTMLPVPTESGTPAWVPHAILTPAPTPSDLNVRIGANTTLPPETNGIGLLAVDILPVFFVFIAFVGVGGLLYYMSYLADDSSKTKMRLRRVAAFSDLLQKRHENVEFVNRPLAEEIMEIDQLCGKHACVPLAWLGFVDFVTDCIFVVHASLGGQLWHGEMNNRSILVIYIASLLAVLLVNTVIAIFTVREHRKSLEMHRWLKTHRCFAVAFGLSAICSPEFLRVCTSQAFGCFEKESRLNAPFTNTARRFVRIGGFLNNLFGDIPQFTLQVVLLIRQGPSTISSTAAILSASLLVVGIFRVLVSKTSQALVRASENNEGENGQTLAEVVKPLVELSLVLEGTQSVRRSTQRDLTLTKSLHNSEQRSPPKNGQDNTTVLSADPSQLSISGDYDSVDIEEHSTSEDYTTMNLTYTQYPRQRMLIWQYDELCKLGPPTEFASGNAGDVFKGKILHDDDEKSTCDVVFKVSKQHGQHERNELATLMELDRHKHPHVVNFVGICLDWNYGNNLAIITEFHPGFALSEYIKRNNVDESRLRDLAYVMASSVTHLHTHQVLHRDVALRNFVLSTDELPVLIDFGLSVKLNHQNNEKTLEVPYRITAPELLGATRRHPLAEFSDVYSLGIAFWELFHKARDPFPRVHNHKQLIEVLRAQHEHAPLTFSKKTPRDIRNLIMRMCSIEPTRRPTALEVCQELRAKTSVLLQPKVKELERLHDEWLPFISKKQRQYTHILNDHE